MYNISFNGFNLSKMTCKIKIRAPYYRFVTLIQTGEKGVGFGVFREYEFIVCFN
jgi:hypothetical protein